MLLFITWKMEIIMNLHLLLLLGAWLLTYSGREVIHWFQADTELCESINSNS